MANLTISLDESVLRAARIRALMLGTSVNAIVREYLVTFVGGAQPGADAARAFKEIAARSTSRLPDRKISRDELHERR